MVSRLSAGFAARCAVIGSPVAHSLSPAVHRAAYRELGLSWEYAAYDVTPEQLAGFVEALRSPIEPESLVALPDRRWPELTRTLPPWRGLSVTMPLKQVIVAHCDSLDDLGRMLGVVNTVVFEAAGSRRGYNTDVAGLVAALTAAGVRRLKSAVVVGSGATARSALAAVAELGARGVTVLARTPARGLALADLAARLKLDLAVADLGALGQYGTDFGGPGGIAPDGCVSGASGGSDSGPGADVLISTIPVEAQPPVAGRLAGLAPTVLDVNYHPAYSPLLVATEHAGGLAIGGFELLLHQAARQLELMTGVAQAPLAAMRAAGLRVLSNR